jgi:hypothetical protein
MKFNVFDCLKDIAVSGQVELQEAERIEASTKGKEYCYHILPIEEKDAVKPLILTPTPVFGPKAGELF